MLALEVLFKSGTRATHDRCRDDGVLAYLNFGCSLEFAVGEALAALLDERVGELLVLLLFGVETVSTFCAELELFGAKKRV